MKQMSIQDLKATLSAAIGEAESGETIVITRHNQPVAQITSARPHHLHRGHLAGGGRLRPAIGRGTGGRYLKVLIDDRGDR